MLTLLEDKKNLCKINEELEETIEYANSLFAHTTVTGNNHKIYKQSDSSQSNSCNNLLMMTKSNSKYSLSATGNNIRNKN